MRKKWPRLSGEFSDTSTKFEPGRRKRTWLRNGFQSWVRVIRSWRLKGCYETEPKSVVVCVQASGHQEFVVDRRGSWVYGSDGWLFMAKQSTRLRA